MNMSGKEYNRFYSALHKGYLSEVRHLIFNEGCQVNYQFKDTSYPIHIVVEKGYLDVVKFLLSLRPSLDLKNCHGQSALMLAMEHPEVVQLLIVHGAKVNVSDPHKRTPLHLASARGSIRLVKELINAGAMVKAKDRWGRNPLHVALLNITHNKEITDNFVQVIKLLLQNGSSVNQPDHQNSTPLFLAAAIGNNGISVAKLLLQQGAHPDLPGRHKLTPLMVGIMKGYELVCQLFIYMNCDVNGQTSNGSSCLKLAVTKDYIDIANLIVESGCKLHEEKWLYNSSAGTQTTTESSELTKWLHELRSTPQTLKQLARSRIRQHFGCTLGDTMKRIHYPEPLKDYVRLSNLLSEMVK